ncbi:hypothetical protein [Sphingomonas cavernae]|uniref:hypothetical protein n=1 Tax=Sphingomonas cavernae TaxID=2320861 RepID=UPI001EE5698C|nr:hypothetical protein [Sphingomonas cavernae]
MGLTLALLAMVGFCFGVVFLVRPIPAVSRKRAGYVLLGSFVVFVAGAIIDGPSATTKGNAAAPKGDLGVETKALWTKFLGSVKACDARSTALAKTSEGNPDIVTLYGLADQAATACSGAAFDVGQLEVPPSASGDARKAFADRIVARASISLASWTSPHVQESRSPIQRRAPAMFGLETSPSASMRST